MVKLRNIGIKEVAILADVSIGTVDRVLHNRKGVSIATKDKVLRIIEETGFKRNIIASRLKLAAVKKISIAVLLPEASAEMVYWNLPIIGIKKAVDELFEQGINVNYFYFKRLIPQTFKSKLNKILKQDFDAIVTVPFFKEETNFLLEKAKEKQTPVVFLDSMRAQDIDGNYISQNSYKAGLVAGRLLHGLVGDQGHYFVFNLINQRGIQINNEQREMGFRAFFQQKLQKEFIQIHSINHHLENKEELTEDQLSLLCTEEIKGIFVSNARAFLVVDMLKDYGISNCKIIGFDLNKQNLIGLQNEEIDFLINQKPIRQGYAAIKGLFKFVTEQDPSELRLDVPVEIIIKENADFGNTS